MVPTDIINAYMGVNPVQAIYMGGDLVWPTTPPTPPVPPEPAYSAMPITFEILSAGELQFLLSQIASPVEFQVNNGGWENYDGSPIYVDQGYIVQFRGENATYATSSGGTGASFFSGNSTYNVYGNIASLVYGENFTSGSLDLRNTNAIYNFAGMFHNADGLISCENLVLPFTALTDDCYVGMFKECHNMTGMVQNLPATIISSQSYRHMFAGCRSLVTAPRDLFIALSGGTLPPKASSSFFYGCSALTKAPILYAVSVSGDCYGAMFRNCPALKIGPVVCAQNIPYDWQQFLSQSTKLDALAYYATSRSSGTFTPSSFAPSGTGKRMMWQAGNNVVPAASGWQKVNMDPDELDDPRVVYEHMVEFSES